MASITLKASPLKSNSTPRSLILFTLNTTKPIVSFPKVSRGQIGLRAAMSSASAPATNGKPLNDIPVDEVNPLKIAIIGFGNFGQFIAKGLTRQGHTVLATSRSDYSDYCKQHGIHFFR